MTSTGGPANDWIQAWIDGQKAALARWSGERQPAGATGRGPFADLFGPAFAAAQSVFGAAAASGATAAHWPLWKMPSAGASGAAGAWWDLPGIGPLREQHAAAQEMAAALAEVERLTAEMGGVMARVHAETLDLLARRAAEHSNQGTPVQDAKALYDLWVECGEATYAKVAHSEAYCRLQADLCNAGIRFQAVERQQMERWLKLLDLPTRSEVNTLNLRIRELQRRLEAATSPPPPKAPARKRAGKPVVAPKRKSRPKT
jgi:class III poly(R)-hydroxyalkanoic acid synthase PhaE subunit